LPIVNTVGNFFSLMALAGGASPATSNGFLLGTIQFFMYLFSYSQLNI